MSFVGFKRPRQRDNRHLDFIRSLPCACCGNPHQTEAAHIRESGLEYGKRTTGGAEKPSDIWTLPLCGDHHRSQHTMSEANFWKMFGINPFVLALSLYACSGDDFTAYSILEKQRGKS